VNRVESDYQNQIKVVYLNANTDGKEAFSAAQFRGHPALLLMQPDGEELWRYQGVATYEQIQDEIVSELESS
jgi:hypothetical protein